MFAFLAKLLCNITFFICLYLPSIHPNPLITFLTIPSLQRSKFLPLSSPSLQNHFTVSPTAYLLPHSLKTTTKRYINLTPSPRFSFHCHVSLVDWKKSQTEMDILVWLPRIQTLMLHFCCQTCLSVTEDSYLFQFFLTCIQKLSEL